MALVAMTTIAVMTHPYGRAEIAGFEELVPSVFDAAQKAPGFVARARPVDDRDDLSNFERDWGRWGSFTTPRFYEGGRTMETDCRASTLSIWEDLESVFQFTYQAFTAMPCRTNTNGSAGSTGGPTVPGGSMTTTWM